MPRGGASCGHSGHPDCSARALSRSARRGQSPRRPRASARRSSSPAALTRSRRHPRPSGAAAAGHGAGGPASSPLRAEGSAAARGRPGGRCVAPGAATARRGRTQGRDDPPPASAEGPDPGPAPGTPGSSSEAAREDVAATGLESDGLESGPRPCGPEAALTLGASAVEQKHLPRGPRGRQDARPHPEEGPSPSSRDPGTVPGRPLDGTGPARPRSESPKQRDVQVGHWTCADTAGRGPGSP